MREIISVGVGETGKGVLTQVHSILKELGPSESEVYFRETNSGERVPRSIWVDLDTSDETNRTGATDQVLVYGDRGTGNWAKGFYSIGDEGLEVFREVVRKRVEGTHSLGGFQTFHNLSGGAGGGLTCRLMDILQEDYANLISQTMSVSPNIRNGGGHAHGYNIIFSLARLQESADRITWIDSEVVEEKGQRFGLLPLNPHYGLINKLAATSISETLLPYSLTGRKEFWISYETAMLCPFPHMCYTMISSPSLLLKNQTRTYGFSEIWSPRNISNFTLSAYTLDLTIPDPKFPLLGSVVTTSHYGSPEGLSNLHTFLSSHTPHPCTVQVNQIPLPPSHPPQYAPPQPSTTSAGPPSPPSTRPSPAARPRTNSMVTNSTHITTPLSYWSDTSRRQFDRRAFVHWYLAEGVDELEFGEAREAVDAVVAVYAAAVRVCGRSLCVCGGACACCCCGCGDGLDEGWAGAQMEEGVDGREEDVSEFGGAGAGRGEFGGLEEDEYSIDEI